DVVHVVGCSFSDVSLEAPVVVTASSCALARWEALTREVDPPCLETYRARVRRGLAKAAAIIAPSAAAMRALALHYESPWAIGTVRRVIPHGVEPVTRRSLAKEPFVFATGRTWDRASGIQMLANAAPRLPWRAIVAGSDRDTSGRKCTPSNVD